MMPFYVTNEAGRGWGERSPFIRKPLRYIALVDVDALSDMMRLHVCRDRGGLGGCSTPICEALQAFRSC